MTKLETIMHALKMTSHLKSLGIIVYEDGNISFGDASLKDRGESYDKLFEDKKESMWLSGGLTRKDICTLALACYQEKTNNVIAKEQIEFVNSVLGDSFETIITFEEVQEFNSKYI